MKRPMREPTMSRACVDRGARPLRCRVPRLEAVRGGNCSSTWLGWGGVRVWFGFGFGLGLGFGFGFGFWVRA